MKKIYALLLGLFAFAWLALVPAAQAQYTCGSYNVRANGDAFTTIDGLGRADPSPDRTPRCG